MKRDKDQDRNGNQIETAEQLIAALLDAKQLEDITGGDGGGLCVTLCTQCECGTYL